MADPSTDTALLIACIAGAVSWGVFHIGGRLAAARAASRRRLLKELAAREGIQLDWDEAGALLEGTARGMRIECRVRITHRAGAETTQRGEIELRAPLSRFVLDICPREHFGEQRGKPSQVRTGDDDFDRTYVVTIEGAPTSWLSLHLDGVLDSTTRRWLTGEQPAWLHADERGVFFEASPLDDDPRLAAALVNLTRLAERLSEPRGYRE
jgi:hypothetical protein